METLVQRLLGAIGVVERIAVGIAVAMMFTVMVVVTADVFMRYVFNRPLSWAYDLISLYLMAGIFFLTLSQAYGAGAHVSVDILQQTFPPWLKRVSECVTCAVAFVAFALIAEFGLDRAIDAFRSHDVIAGAIAWPTWPAIALVPLGTGLLCLRLAVHFCAHLGSLLTGRSLIAVSAGEHSGGEIFE